jgi:membrane-bound lytic murein transglycosylase B
MGDRSDHRAAVGQQLRRAATLALAACLLASCSAQGTGPGGSPTSSGAAATRHGSPGAPPQDRVLRFLPAAPETGNPAALARQLDLAEATLQDRRASAADVRRAGEFQQLAARTLATGPDALLQKVTARLAPEAASVTRSQVAAARSLRSMTRPQRKLPHWRIVAPLPATELVGYYREAQRRTGVPWTYLAAINLVETRMGRLRGVSTAGARGPMQFLPSTWDLYGAGGDIDDPHDAILAAARLLKANGAPDDMAGALRHFNPSDDYVHAVSAYARTMQQSPPLYRGYWHWRVLYRHVRGTYVLPPGYPHVHAVLLGGH